MGLKRWTLCQNYVQRVNKPRILRGKVVPQKAIVYDFIRDDGQGGDSVDHRNSLD